LSVASTPRARAPKKGAHPAVAAAVENLMLEERTRWAMAIHDGLTQTVTSAVLEIQTLRQRIEAEPEEAIVALREIEEAIREDLKQIREILFELQEGERHDEPPIAGSVKELVERWKLSARVSLEGDLDAVSPRIVETAHGIIAEALANVAKHSGTSNVSLRVRVIDGELRIEVEDRGRGIPMIAVKDAVQHFGLQLMRARAEEIGGSVDISSSPGKGTKVIAALPVEEGR
jgi:two-component system, NarL family, nitrate/nitrite sensor histidine kinase NarX